MVKNLNRSFPVEDTVSGIVDAVAWKGKEAVGAADAEENEACAVCGTRSCFC